MPRRSKFENEVASSIRGNAKYEKYKISYTTPEKKHYYKPDFLLENGIIVESKGLFCKADRDKMLLVREQYPNLEIRLLFQNAKAPLYIGGATKAKTTVAAWAEKHGFIYAVGKSVPEEWEKEPQHDITGLIEIRPRVKKVKKAA